MEKNKQLLHILIDEPGWNDELSELDNLSQQVMEKVFNYVSQHEEMDFLDGNRPVIINLSLSSDEHIHKLNQEFRGIDKPTNVLSFARIDDEDFIEEAELFNEIELGDIIIALETMQREAKEKKISLHDHYCHLLTHGLLHLLGFDHMEDADAEYMESTEINILQQLNIKNPYEELS